MTANWLVRPWRRAFREDFCLPSGVRGPVDFWAFKRLISSRVRRFFLRLEDTGGRVSFAGSENAKELENWELLAAEEQC
jgi:hypothetical protein